MRRLTWNEKTTWVITASSETADDLLELILETSDVDTSMDTVRSTGSTRTHSRYRCSRHRRQHHATAKVQQGVIKMTGYNITCDPGSLYSKVLRQHRYG